MYSNLERSLARGTISRRRDKLDLHCHGKFTALTGGGRSYDPTRPKPRKVHKLVAVGHMTQLSRNMAFAQNVQMHVRIVVGNFQCHCCYVAKEIKEDKT